MQTLAYQWEVEWSTSLAVFKSGLKTYPIPPDIYSKLACTIATTVHQRHWSASAHWHFINQIIIIIIIIIMAMMMMIICCLSAINQWLQRSWKHQVHLHAEHSCWRSRYQPCHGWCCHSLWLWLEPASRPTSHGRSHAHCYCCHRFSLSTQLAYYIFQLKCQSRQKWPIFLIGQFKLAYF